VVVGTTGESPTLVRSEELRLFREIKETLGDSASVIAGTGSNSTAEALEATLQAEQTGVDGCLLVTPYYNKPSQEGLYQHYAKIAAATKLPCILYNVPGRSGINLAGETTIRLSAIDNIVGLKEASGNLAQVAQIISGVPSDFKVWSGNDGDNFALMALGGYGAISVASHLVGLQIKQMMDLILSGDVAAAAAIHRGLLPLVDRLFIVSNPVPVKYALNQIGFNVGPTRLPLVAPDDKSAALIMEAVRAAKIDIKV
jgi:4-hydroxy-tetrahydrodipicolinate synthase